MLSGDVASLAVSKHLLRPAPGRMLAPSVQAALLVQLEFALYRQLKMGDLLTEGFLRYAALS
jgi:hypothetical protein